MELYRDIILQLEEWKNRSSRKPLIMQGARQVGKTWILKHFGNKCFDNTAYFNFDANASLNDVFEHTKDPQRILEQLRLYTQEPIVAGQTLIIFDEIQECNKAINALKYFCEDAPQYHIVAAGSLLGVALSQGDSFPVGKVEFCEMTPLTLREYVRSVAPDLCSQIDNMAFGDHVPAIIHTRMLEYYQQYLVVGGMPAAVALFADNKGMEAVEREQSFIINSYTRDFSKHAKPSDVPRIIGVWESIPNQLARENRKFIFRTIRTGARARDYENALAWLHSAALIRRVMCCTKPLLPIKAYDDTTAFKVYLNDCGLLRSLAALPPEAIIDNSQNYREFKGAMAENFVLQSLSSQYIPEPRYWVSEGKAEVDFLVQHGCHIIPIEVKAGLSTAGRSLVEYARRFAPTLMLRLSLNPWSRKGELINCPIYLAPWLKGIIDQQLSLATDRQA